MHENGRAPPASCWYWHRNHLSHPLHPQDCSVVAHGASPNDDTKDDTDAFTRALAACSGGSVTAPPGFYRIDGTVQIGNTSRELQTSLQPSSVLPNSVLTTRFGCLLRSHTGAEPQL